MKNLRIAVWGLGRHATNRLLPAIAAARGLELAGVCSRNHAAVAECARRWCCDGWSETAAMLRAPSVDIVYVATPSGLHAEHGRQVLGAGKHLLCEKPFTCHREHTLDLLSMAEQAGLAVGEGHMYLHHPQFAQLVKYLESGRLGPVRSIACRFGIPTLDFSSFRYEPALGGGALLDIGCYPISALRALFPGAQYRVSHSRVTTRPESNVDTDGYAVVELSTGAVAHLEWRTHCAYQNQIEIWGDRGALLTERIFSKPADYVPSFHLRDVCGVEIVEHGEPGDHFVAMLESFAAMIYDNRQSRAERSRIAGCAETLEQIWRAAPRADRESEVR